MIEILLNIILSPELILLATFFRTSPISGTNSGKLKFANLTTNAILTEGEKGITISTFFNQAIDFRELAFGNGTGITSSEFFKFDPTFPQNRPRLFGPGQIVGKSGWYYTQNLNWGLYRHSFIIGGCCNEIAQDFQAGTFSCYDLIINGKCNYTVGFSPESGAKNSSKFNTIITGYKSKILGGCHNSLINSGTTIAYGTPDGYTGCVNHNISINSKIVTRGNSKHNTIISSMPKFCYQGMKYLPYENDRLKGVYYSSIISSVGNKVTLNWRTGGGGTTESKKSKFNSIISSFDSYITNSEPGTSLTHSSYNTILASSLSKIFNYKSSFPVSGNSIISSCKSYIYDSDSSSIIGGNNNSICNDFSKISAAQRRLQGSALIGGCCNLIRFSSDTIPSPFTSKPSTIIGGYNNCIFLGYRLDELGGSVILGGGKNRVTKSNSASISSEYAIICGPESAIISSCRSISAGTSSAIISSCCTPVGIGQYSTLISSSRICPQLFSCSSIISSNNVTFCETIYLNTVISSKRAYFCCNAGTNLSCLSAIIASDLSLVKETCNSIISGQGFNRTYFSKSSMNFSSNCLCCTTNSGILSAINSCICCACNSFIIGGYANKICWSSGFVCNSIILGSCNKGLTLSNTVMTQHFNFACSCIFSSNTSLYCGGIVGTFSNCFYCSLKIINGFITS